jgi:dihydroorotase
MSLYVGHLEDIIANYNVIKQYQLHPSVTPKVIAEAAAAGIIGVKMYPPGKALTTRLLHPEAAVLM